MSELKVFQICTDFIVARDEESAKRFYVEMVGEDDCTVQDGLEVSEVPNDKWSTMKIVDMDEPGHPTQTFQEAIDDMLTWDNQEYPKCLASTEY
jgi:hypothetical protein